MKLAETQRCFSMWLQTGSNGAAASFGDRAANGLAVYQNNFRAQLAGCLEESFERTRQWIGDEAFHEAVVHHIGRVPPSSWTLDAYPRDFPVTLALRYPADPEVAELAALELALAEAFVGPDAVSLTVENVASVDWDSAVLVFTPTLDLLPLTTNAPAIWSALVSGRSPPVAHSLPERGALLSWRRDEVSQFRAIDTVEEHAILDLRNGMAFADFCTQVVRELGSDMGIAVTGAWLDQWLDEGLLVDIRPD